MISTVIGDVGLTHLIAQWGIPVKTFRPSKTPFRAAYGSSAGQESYTMAAQVDVVVTGDDFTPVDAKKAGMLDEAWVFAQAGDVNVGDRIEVARADGKARRFHVERIDGAGTTADVLKRYRILAIGD